ncbi:hypothetical protein RYX36_028902 [Vicia faba]
MELADSLANKMIVKKRGPLGLESEKVSSILEMMKVINTNIAIPPRGNCEDVMHLSVGAFNALDNKILIPNCEGDNFVPPSQLLLKSGSESNISNFYGQQVKNHELIGGNNVEIGLPPVSERILDLAKLILWRENQLEKLWGPRLME